MMEWWIIGIVGIESLSNKFLLFFLSTVIPVFQYSKIPAGFCAAKSDLSGDLPGETQEHGIYSAGERAMKSCHRCGKELNGTDKVSRTATCPHCGVYLHCCLNCAFYDPHVHNQCREPQSEYVSDREKANFCDFFTFRESGPSGKREGEVAKARKAWEELFKKPR
jgi:hypothetical protein